MGPALWLTSLRPSSALQKALCSGLERPQPVHRLLCAIYHADALFDQVPAGFQPQPRCLGWEEGCPGLRMPCHIKGLVDTRDLHHSGSLQSWPRGARRTSSAQLNMGDASTCRYLVKCMLFWY